MPGGLIRFPQLSDERGSLSFIEGERHLPFVIRRTWWLSGSVDGSPLAQASLLADECLIALTGSFDVRLDDGSRQWTVTAENAAHGVLVPRRCWRQIENFSSGAVCLALSSAFAADDELIRDYGTFRTRGFAVRS